MYLATVLDCCTKKAVGYAIGATARGTGSGVRGDRHGGPQVPVHDRGDDPPTPGRGTPVHLRPVCLPPGGPRNSPSGGKDRDALGGCPGGSRQAPPSRNKRVYQMVHHRKKRDRPGYRLPGRARHTSQTQSHPAPVHRTQDEDDQKHRATRQTARDTPDSPSPAGNLADPLPSAKTPQSIE